MFKGNRGYFFLKRLAYVHFLRKHRYHDYFLIGKESLDFQKRECLRSEDSSPTPQPWEEARNHILLRCELRTTLDPQHVLMSTKPSWSQKCYCIKMIFRSISQMFLSTFEWLHVCEPSRTPIGTCLADSRDFKVAASHLIV